MQTSANGNPGYSFGSFTLDVSRGALRKDGSEVKLRPQSFGVLRYLVENSGRLVTRDELLNAIWGDAVVTDGSLTQCLIEIRRALGDQSRQAIRTVPRRGYILELPVESTGPPDHSPAVVPPRTAPKWRWRYRAAALAFACVVALIWSAFALHAPDAPASAAAGRPTNPDSIAVLPFVDMSPASDHQYLSDGIAEEILNLLSQSPQLQVIARTSSFSFRDKDVDIATIAKQLNVATVLEGSLRTAGKRVRVTAQLVDAATNSRLWSETYDHELGDVLALEREIAAAAAEALKIELVERPEHDGTVAVPLKAYKAYLQGWFFYNRRGPGDIERAEDYFRKALAIDPAYARAWAGLAGVCMVRIDAGELAPETGRTLCQESVERALRYGPGLAESHLRAAQFYFSAGDSAAADDQYLKAQAIDPNNTTLLAVAAGHEASVGRLDEAIELQKRVVQLDPLSYIEIANLAIYLAGDGRFDDARTEFFRALALNPADADRIAVDTGFLLLAQRRAGEAFASIKQWPEGVEREQGLAMVYYALGRHDQSDAALQRLTARPGISVARRVAEVYAWRGDFDRSFRWLQTAREREPTDSKQIRNDRLTVEARVSPFLRVLHDDSRWDAYFASLQE